MNKTYIVVGAFLDTQHLTLYLESGETVQIKQGDIRLADVLEQVKPLAAKPGEPVTVILENGGNVYADYEKKSGGLTKFFKIGKKLLSNLLGIGSDDPLKVGEKIGVTEFLNPVAGEQAALAEPEKKETPAVPEKTLSAIDSIMAHAQPVSAENFQEPEKDSEEETIIAVKDGVVIDNMEALKPQLAHAVATDQMGGMEKFMARMAAVASKRRHSAEDLLKFLKRGDLPIADDGSIIIYKILRKRVGHYVDCHTRLVPQKVGSYVCMDEKLVDHNRRNECSNGLHVARRQYLGNFSGDICVLAKLDPEDVIAVPDYDANKMRVCGYHILGELSDKEFQQLKSNKPFDKGSEGFKLLASALAGNHVARLEEVRITQQGGGGVQVKKLDSVKAEVAPEIVAVKREKTELLSEDTVAPSAKAIDPRTVAKEVTEAKASRKDQAQAMYFRFVGTPTKENAQALLDFKKAAKVNWDKLGINDKMILSLKNAVHLAVPQAPVATIKKTTEKIKTKSGHEIKVVTATIKETKVSGTPREQIQALLKLNLREQATNILSIKQKSKKSWDVLGVPADTVERIKKLTK